MNELSQWRDDFVRRNDKDLTIIEINKQEVFRETFKDSIVNFLTSKEARASSSTHWYSSSLSLFSRLLISEFAVLRNSSLSLFHSLLILSTSSLTLKRKMFVNKETRQSIITSKSTFLSFAKSNTSSKDFVIVMSSSSRLQHSSFLIALFHYFASTFLKQVNNVS